PAPAPDDGRPLQVVVVDLLRLDLPDRVRYRYLLLVGPPLTVRVCAEFELHGPDRWPAHSGLLPAFGGAGPRLRWQGTRRSERVELLFTPSGVVEPTRFGGLLLGPASLSLDWRRLRGVALWWSEHGAGAPPAVGRRFAGVTADGTVVVENDGHLLLRRRGGKRRRAQAELTLRTGPGIEAAVGASPVDLGALDRYRTARAPAVPVAASAGGEGAEGRSAAGLLMVREPAAVAQARGRGEVAWPGDRRCRPLP
ncbi:MAG: hypothetical protein D6729_07920, partial [Deltaproteobacteria bacterium]